jgi:hypothetical protein
MEEQQNQEFTYHLPGFKNGMKLTVSLEHEDDTPFYFNPWFLTALCLLGLGHISLIIMLFYFPGETTFGTNGK